MAPNTTTTNGGESNTDHPAADVEAIVVDPEDVIEMMRRNARDRDEQRRHSLRISAPFGGELRATPHVTQRGNYYPPELSQKPIHLGASVFLAGHSHYNHPDFPDSCGYPIRLDERAKFRDQFGYRDDDGGYRELTDDEEAEWEEWWETVLEVWREEVRRNLKDEATLESQTVDGRVETAVEIRCEEREE